jgi:hypothetical protein
VTGAAGIVAGVDVGNTTTEIVIAAHDGDRWAVVAFDPGLLGRLCVPGADGHLVPFSDGLSPQDWRRTRLDLKAHVFTQSLRRALNTLDTGAIPHTVLLAGGGAEDDELVAVTGKSLPDATVGRADVAGRFGPRYAVAWGLALLAGRPPNSDLDAAPAPSAHDCTSDHVY